MDFANKIPQDFSGVVSIKQNGKKLFQTARGYRDIANAIPNETDTKFATASAGKAFVAAAILRLIEKRAIDFDSAIGDMLTFDLKDIDPKITVRQLLNHTSGIPDYFDESVMDDYEELWRDIPNYRIRTSADLVPLFTDKPMMYPRGERFQCNNTGYVVLGLIIEAVTKMPFDEYLKREIFTPCEMASTGYYEMDRLPANCAYAYIRDDESGGYRTNIYSVDAKGTGAGGAFTTADDIERFWDSL
jgi:CubicO group peptidase (beta-lactamase class C family)